MQLAISILLLAHSAYAVEQGTILREYWSDITGTSVTSLTSSPAFPTNSTGQSYPTSFEAPSNWANNYGTRMRGTLHPTVSGTYQFWIAGDDNSQLWLSLNANPLQKQLIAHVPGWSAPRSWTKYPQQQSALMTLTAGETYYIEALQKEGGGLDNLSVAWTGPGIGETPTIIAGNYLAPIHTPFIHGAANFTTSTTVTMSASLTGGTLYYTTDGSTPTTASASYSEPIIMTQSTCFHVMHRTDAGVKSDIAKRVFLRQGSGTGLTGAYFSNENLSGDAIIRQDPTVHFSWGSSSPITGIASDHFSVRWQGDIETSFAQPYQLIARSDDGVRMWIDGVLVINDWTYHGAKDNIITLTPGRHSLCVEYKEGTGSAVMQLQWQNAFESRRAVPMTQLYPLLGVATVIPTTSAVSPVYIEAMKLSDTTLSVTVNSVAEPLSPLDATADYLNVPLQAAALTNVVVTAQSGEMVSGDIAWTPTLLMGESTHIIRKNDSLLFEAPVDGSLVITNYSGTYQAPTPTTAGQTMPVKFTKAGEFTVRYVDTEGVEQGMAIVTVVWVDLSQQVLCELGYARAINLPVSPNNPPITFIGNKQLTVSNAQIASDNAQVTINPLQRGTPRLLARIHGPQGPLITTREIDEFTINTPALKNAVVNAGTGIGTLTLTMSPYIAHESFNFVMFAHTATFRGGAKSMSVSTTGGPSTNGEAPFAQVFDENTQETIGTFSFEIEVPSNEDKYCFRIERRQEPAASAPVAWLKSKNILLPVIGKLPMLSYEFMMGATPPGPPNGPTSNVNGVVCHKDGKWSGAQLILLELEDVKEEIVKFTNTGGCPELFKFDIDRESPESDLSFSISPGLRSKMLDPLKSMDYTVKVRNKNPIQEPPPKQFMGLPDAGVWAWELQNLSLGKVTLTETTLDKKHELFIFGLAWLWTKQQGDNPPPPPPPDDDNGDIYDARGGSFIGGAGGFNTNPETYTSDGRYRGVDIYGAPKSDSSPTGEEESDRVPDNISVDMLNLSASYSQTDWSLPCEGGELAIEFRRNAGIRSLDVTPDPLGARAQSRLTLPNQLLLGHSWSTNLGAHVAVDFIGLGGELPKAVVTDDLGEVLTYQMNARDGQVVFEPVNSLSGWDHRALKASLAITATDAQGYAVSLRLTKRYGTAVEYVYAGLFRSVNMTAAKRIYRVARVVDRNGNAIIYNYQNPPAANILDNSQVDGRLLITNMHEQQHPERSLSFTYQKLYDLVVGFDTGWRLTNVTDPSGRTISYQYEDYGPTPTVPYTALGSLVAQAYNPPPHSAMLSQIVRPPLIAGGGVGAQPKTRYTYRVGDVTPSAFELKPGEANYFAVIRFIAPEKITDARGHATTFTYKYEEFPTPKYYGAPEVNLCLHSIKTDAGTMTVGTDQRTRGIAQNGLVEDAIIRTHAIDTTGVRTDYRFTMAAKSKFEFLKRILVNCERTTMVGGVAKTATFAYAKDHFGNLTKVTDINGNVITYDYTHTELGDPANNKLDGLYTLDQGLIPNTYQLMSLPCTRTVGPGGLKLVTKYRRDVRFRALIRQVDAEQIRTYHELDSKGNRIRITEGQGLSGLSGFSGFQGVPGFQGDQRETRFEYQPDGFMSATVDPDGRRTEFVRLFSGITPNSAEADRTTYRTITTKQFPAPNVVLTKTSIENLYGDKLAEVDGKNQRTDFVYDPHHRMVVSLSPAVSIPPRANAYVSGSTSHRQALPGDLTGADAPIGALVRARSDVFYDLNGNVVWQVDDNGHVTVTTYDFHNRPVTVRRRMVDALLDNTEDIVTHTSYTPRGQVLRTTDARGNYSEITYDGLFRPVLKDLPPLNAGGPRLVEEMFYGNNSGAGTWTVRSGWQPTRYINARKFAIDTTYDAIYRPIQVVQRFASSLPPESAAPGDLDLVTETMYNRVHKPVRILMRDDGNRWRATFTYYDQLYRVSGTVVTSGNKATLMQVAPNFRADGFTLSANDFISPFVLDVRIAATRYDRAGHVIQSRDPQNRIVDMAYDKAGRLTHTRAPEVADAAHNNAMIRPMTQVFYDANSNPEMTQDARGTRAKSFYDARQRVTATILDLDGDGQFETNGDDITASMVFDLANQAVQTTDARGLVSDQYRDAAGRVVVTQLPAVADAEAGDVLTRPQIQSTFDGNGNAVVMQDARGVVTQMTYDFYNRATTVQSAVGTADAVTTTTSYDANGNVISLTLLNGTQPQTTTYSYDGLNRKTSETLPSIGDGIMRETTWAYTQANEVRFKREPAGNDVTTTFDGFGQTTTVVVTGGSSLNRAMTYTATGKLATLSETENRQGVVRSRTSTLFYDNLDRQITESYVSNSDQPHHVFSGYDLNGNRVIATADVAAAQPGSIRQSQSTFDRANRVITIMDLGRAMAGGGFATSTYHYDQSGNRLSLLRPDGIIDAYTYDALNRVAQATTTGPGQAPGNLYQVSYTYDLVGNRRTALEFTAGLGGRDLVYTYDQQYRLTGETETTTSRVRTTTWGYDQAGNRLEQIKTLQDTPPAPALASTTTTTTNYQVDALNRLNNWTASTVFSNGATTTTSTKQCTYAYDNNGNQSDETHVSNGAVSKQHHLHWDGLNRLITVTDVLQAGGTVIFSTEYDARMRRRLTQEGPTTTLFRYDGGDAYQELKNGGRTSSSRAVHRRAVASAASSTRIGVQQPDRLNPSSTIPPSATPSAPWVAMPKR